MATGSNDNLVIIFDIKKVWEIKKCISAHKDIIYEVEFAQNNKWLASGSRDNTVKIWDT
jgi:glucose repression regulatory protein TUP1